MPSPASLFPYLMAAMMVALAAGSLRQARAFARLEAQGVDPTTALPKRVLPLARQAIARSMLILGWIYFIFTGLRIPQDVVGLSLRGWQWALAVILPSAVAAVGVKLLTALLVLRTNGRFVSRWFERAILPQTMSELGWAYLAMIPVVLYEELFFRGMWVGGLDGFLPVWALVITGALFFAAAHAIQNVAGMVFAFILGLILGVLFVWTGGILTPFAAHFAYNAAAITLAWYIKSRRKAVPPAAQPA